MTTIIGKMLSDVKLQLKQSQKPRKDRVVDCEAISTSIEYPQRIKTHKATFEFYFDIIETHKIILVNGLNLSSKSWKYTYDSKLCLQATRLYTETLKLIIERYKDYVLIYQTADDDVGNQAWIHAALLDTEFKEVSEAEVVSNETDARLRFYIRESQ